MAGGGWRRRRRGEWPPFHSGCKGCSAALTPPCSETWGWWPHPGYPEEACQTPRACHQEQPLASRGRPHSVAPGRPWPQDNGQGRNTLKKEKEKEKEKEKKKMKFRQKKKKKKREKKGNLQGSEEAISKKSRQRVAVVVVVVVVVVVAGVGGVGGAGKKKGKKKARNEKKLDFLSFSFIFSESWRGIDTPLILITSSSSSGRQQPAAASSQQPAAAAGEKN